MKYSFLLAILLVLVGQSPSLANNNTTGPKAKNQKTWQKETVNRLISYEKNKVTSLKAKNTKPWQKSNDKVKEVVLKPRPSLFGPRAKNRKVW